jgi:predicted enzyme related to lactoylglutathione lyase
LATTGIGRLVYLYTGSSGVEADVVFYRDLLGGELVWRRRAMGTEVAAIKLGGEPLLLLADHRDAPSVLPIWSVEDVAATESSLREAGWSGSPTLVEVPDGPCLILHDPSGNEIGLLQQVRPGLLQD